MNNEENVKVTTNSIPSVAPEGEFIVQTDASGNAGLYVGMGDSVKELGNTRVLGKTPIYFNSVADMKSDTSLRVGDMCITLGYYTAGDDGGGEYYVVEDNSLVDDGGSVHELLKGLKAKLIIVDSTISVDQYGAKGDGVSIDTTCFNRAINKLNSVRGTLKLGCKKYRLDSTITIKSNIFAILGQNIDAWGRGTEILADIIDDSPVFDYEKGINNMTLGYIEIKPFDSNSIFTGIRYSYNEYCITTYTVVRGATVGYLIAPNEVNGSTYLSSWYQVSAFNCDTGIKVDPKSRWSNGLKFNIKDLSRNRIGFYAKGGSGNTIEGNHTEIGFGEIGIQIDAGHWTIGGYLWMENATVTPLQINGGTVNIMTEIYTIGRTPQISPRATVRTYDYSIQGVETYRNIYDGLVGLFSFDELAEDYVIDKVTGSKVMINSNNIGKRSSGNYGHSIYRKPSSGQQPKLTIPKPLDFGKDWTIMINLNKPHIPTSGGDDSNYIFEARDGDNILRMTMKYAYGKYTDPLMSVSLTGYSGKNSTTLSQDGRDNFWLIVKYDSTTKTVYPSASSGAHGSSNKIEYDLTNFNPNSVSFCLDNTHVGGNTNEISIDEIVFYQRLLTEQEISYVKNNISQIYFDTLTKGANPPNIGTWFQGDIIYNTAPSPNNFVGWVCITSGTPGTWKGFGLIES